MNGWGPADAARILAGAAAIRLGAWRAGAAGWATGSAPASAACIRGAGAPAAGAPSAIIGFVAGGSGCGVAAKGNCGWTGAAATSLGRSLGESEITRTGLPSGAKAVCGAAAAVVVMPSWSAAEPRIKALPENEMTDSNATMVAQRRMRCMVLSRRKKFGSPG
jgi:hypothetical protein